MEKGKWGIERGKTKIRWLSDGFGDVEYAMEQASGSCIALKPACRREETRSGARLTLLFMYWHTGLKNLMALSYDHGTRIATYRGASQLEKKIFFSRRISDPRT